ncbi:hypothetical protein FJW07_30760 [Mesorhizobium sp. B3-1-9]|uniref:hypothetical protein n=1 Tax=Mesorhizobium sp. B3-1-9 TaxID=2589892 RepID=UPI00112651FD|nr:hypothetical protein [Mesorhizobium sp. B3-1-9]TPI28804.1 hypothetical protein FJW07_30760 [Mesorhizobium sp. B3-1-9]
MKALKEMMCSTGNFNSRLTPCQELSRSGLRDFHGTYLKEKAHAQETASYADGRLNRHDQRWSRKGRVLTLETLGEDIEIAVNLQAVDVITKALNALGQELRK